MTLYEKIGEEYVPVRDTEAFDGLSNGCHLVVIERGCTSSKRTVEPSTSSVQLAYFLVQRKIENIIAKACEARPKSTPLTKKEQRAIKAYYDIMGKEKMLMFTWPSIHDIAEQITDSIKNGGQ